MPGQPLRITAGVFLATKAISGLGPGLSVQRTRCLRPGQAAHYGVQVQSGLRGWSVGLAFLPRPPSPLTQGSDPAGVQAGMSGLTSGAQRKRPEARFWLVYPAIHVYAASSGKQAPGT